MNTFNNPELMLRLAQLKNSEDIARAARHRRVRSERSRSSGPPLSRWVAWLTLQGTRHARAARRPGRHRRGRMRLLGMAVVAMVTLALGAAYAPTPSVGATDGSSPASFIAMLDLTGVSTHSIEPTATIPSGLRFVITMAVAGGRVWVASPDGLVSIDPDTNQATVASELPGAGITGEGDTLIRDAFGRNALERWNARTGQLEWSVDSDAPSGSAIAGNEIWVADHHAGTLSIRSLTDGTLLDQMKVGAPGDGGPAVPIVAQGTVWVTDYRNHRVVAIDLATRRVTARMQVPIAVQFCDQRPAVTATAVWISDCSTLVTRVDIARRDAVTVDATTPAGTPLALDTEAWVPIDGRFVHVRDDLTADRAVSIAGQPQAFGGVVAFGSVWANVGFGTIVRLPAPDDW